MSDENELRERLEQDGAYFTKRPVKVRAFKAEKQYTIETKEGVMTANAGDYIICGTANELYPCKPEIFEEIYDQDSPKV